MKTRIKSAIVVAIIAILAYLVGFLGELWFTVLVTFPIYLIILREIISTKALSTDSTLTLFFFVYVAFALIVSMAWLRSHEPIWFPVGFGATALFDIVALLIGKPLGKHKIVPSISPGKSWEGTIGGLVVTTTAVTFVGTGFLSSPFDFSLYLGLVISAGAFFGDLLESYYKRKLGIKDFGNLIPGHGGVFDRLDSHLMVCPALYVIFLIKSS